MLNCACFWSIQITQTVETVVETVVKTVETVETVYLVKENEYTINFL